MPDDGDGAGDGEGEGEGVGAGGCDGSGPGSADGGLGTTEDESQARQTTVFHDVPHASPVQDLELIPSQSAPPALGVGLVQKRCWVQDASHAVQPDQPPSTGTTMSTDKGWSCAGDLAVANLAGRHNWQPPRI